MSAESEALQQDAKQPFYKVIHPKRMLMWLYLISTLMAFAGLTSAVVVSYGDHAMRGTWASYNLPDIFQITTVLVVLSSITMHWAFIAARRDNYTQVNIGLIITIGLGILFLVGQYLGFQSLIEKGIYLVQQPDDPSPSGSFIYVLTGLHGLHLIAALIVLTIMVIKAILYQIHSKNTLGLELATTFWHALGFLWVYLFVFLTYIYQ
jgi:cytochrome c oxidase subunit 3